MQQLQLTLEELIREVKDHIEYRMAIQNIKEDKVHVIVHPMGVDGSTIDLVVKGNKITPLITMS